MTTIRLCLQLSLISRDYRDFGIPRIDASEDQQEDPFVAFNRSRIKAKHLLR